MIKHILTILLILLSIPMIHPADSMDDMYLDFSLDDLTRDAETIVTKESPQQKMIVNGSVEVTQKSGFQYSIIRESVLNPDNVFYIDNYQFFANAKILAEVSITPYFKFYADCFFQFTMKGNELDLQTDNDGNKKEFSGELNELYVSATIPLHYPVKFSIGRMFFRQENSLGFSIFNGLSWDKKLLGGTFSDNTPGANMVKFSMYFPYINFDIIYSPGSVVDNDTTAYFHIPKEQRFYTMLNCNLPQTDFGFNGYFDSDLQWGAGTTVSVTVYDDLILYSDFSVQNYNPKKRLVKKDEYLYDDMKMYEWEETQSISFTGTLLGINFSPKSIISMYTEIFYNSNGFSRDEQSIYFDAIQDIKKNYKNPSYPSMAPNADSIKQQFTLYYFGLLAQSLASYDAVSMGSLFIFSRVGKSDIASSGVELLLSSLTSCFDGSTLLIPQISYNFLKYCSIRLYSNIFIGYPGALFGEIPYVGTINFEVELKL